LATLLPAGVVAVVPVTGSFGLSAGDAVRVKVSFGPDARHPVTVTDSFGFGAVDC
jgi:hypothetical protein